jgi:hypothetical protein
MAMEEHWQPDVFGESNLALIENVRTSEAKFWDLAATILNPDQQAELKQAIAEWHRKNPSPESLLTARTLGFAAEIAQAARADQDKPGSVFGLLRVDPLAGLDPAMREIAKTRLFAERALYVAQKMPILLRWQTELLALNTIQLPPVQQLVSNSTQLSASVERFARVAEQLPGQLSSERAEILKSLESQEKSLKPLVADVRDTLAAGTQMSVALNTALISFDALMRRFGVGEPSSSSASKTNDEPFRILDYAQTAARVDEMARQLTELLTKFDQTLGSTNLYRLSAQVGPVVEQAQSSGKQIVDYAFWKGGLFVAIVFAAMLVYRILTARLAAPTRAATNAP